MPLRVRSSDHVALGRAVRELRTRRGLTQDVLAFDAGVSTETLGCIERATLNPSFEPLLRIVRALGSSVGELAEVYERHLAEIDPHAGREVPLSPTPEALAHQDRVNAHQRARIYAAQLKGRMRSWT